MKLTVNKKKTSDTSKLAALIKRNSDKYAKNLIITISDNAPESIKRTGKLPKTAGWKTIWDVPLKTAHRKDYVKFLTNTKAREVWIRSATSGGASMLYTR